MRRTLLLASLFLCSFALYAQRSITGKITDSKTGSPLAGATIKVKSSKKGTSSNNEGNFTILLGPGELLEITSIGYEPQSIEPPGSATLLPFF